MDKEVIDGIGYLIIWLMFFGSAAFVAIKYLGRGIDGKYKGQRND